MDEEIVHQFRKNAQEVVCATLGQFNSRDVVSIRVYYRDDDDELKPTRKGITLSADKLPELETAISKLREALVETTEAG